jgi:Xaa-Pro dipeptidase
MNMPIDKTRLLRIQDSLKEYKIDGLICQLSENVVFLTGFWPLSGTSWVVFSADGRYELIIPACEAIEANKYGQRDFSTYEWAHLKADDSAKQITSLLKSICSKLDIDNGVIGIEENFSNIAPSLNTGESCVPCKSSKDLILKALPKANILDATDIINNLRSTKTNNEIEKLKIANDIAGFGLAEFKNYAQEGINEIELACKVNSSIASKGCSYKNTISARGFAQISSGQGTERAWRPCEITTNRNLKNGDIVILELGVVADGLWADNTRLVVIGGANKKQKEIYNILLNAQSAAIEKIRPGTKMGDVDKAARDVIDDAGYGEYFIHITGHGIGWRYHEFPPLLAPKNEATLEEGMVTSVEPGVYIPNFGGMRVEDIVAVGKDGANFLSTFHKELD